MFQKGSRIEKSLDKRYHDFVEIFCLTVPSFCGEPFNESKKLGHPKILLILCEFRDFPWKSFSLTVPKNFVGNPFVFQNSSSTEKICR